jgi:hypothetical protein
MCVFTYDINFAFINGILFEFQENFLSLKLKKCFVVYFTEI